MLDQCQMFVACYEWVSIPVIFANEKVEIVRSVVEKNCKGRDVDVIICGKGAADSQVNI